MTVTRKPRPLPPKPKQKKVKTNQIMATEPVTPAVMEMRAHVLWSHIRTEYITDPTAPTIETLARKYHKQIGFDMICKRAKMEKWTTQREEWWSKAELALLQRIRDEYLEERAEEMKKIREARDFIYQHMLPLKDRKTGEVIRNDETGLPEFPYAFRSQESVIKAFLLLQERMMLLRGEAIVRSETQIRDRTEAVEEVDPISQIAAKANFSRDEIRMMARKIIEKRNALQEGQEVSDATDLSEAESDDSSELADDDEI